MGTKGGRVEGVKDARDGDGGIPRTPPRKYLGLAPRWWLAIGLIMAFVGVNLQFLTHIVPARWFGMGLIISGMATAVYWVRFIERSARKRKLVRRRDLADRFMHSVTFRGRLRPWFPILGIIVILIDLGWNLGVARSTDFLSQDWTMWALGVVLLAYNFVPSAYGRERDFALILVVLYSITMVLPMGLYRLATGTVDLPGGFVYWMLGVPVAAIVSLTGAWASAHGIFIDFQMSTGQYSSLGISTGCAGLDSLFLFISGFVAFMLVENPRLNLRIGAALAIGILTAYFANLLRMVIIVEAGVYWGHDAMMAVHENAGTLIFLSWIAVFWYLMYRFVLRRPRAVHEAGAATAIGADRAGGDGEPGAETLNCANCGAEVDPAAIPEKCRECGQAFDPGVYCEKCGAEVDPEDLPQRCPSCANPFTR